MDFDIPAFRTSFPEFNDAEIYPTHLIEFWVGLAAVLVLPAVWKNAWVQGTSLYVAHQLTIAAHNKKTASNGGAPGTFGGVANNKTVGSATVGYDSQSTSEQGAGFWNLTNYGRQFYRLVKIFGARPIQL